MRNALVSLAISFAVALALVLVLAPRWPLGRAAVLAVVGAWGWRFIRRLWARIASSALRAGNVGRARRWYWGLRLTSLDSADRAACRLCLAACDAAGGRYQRALERLAAEDPSRLTEPLAAVRLNLRAYCRGRLGQDLSDALDDIDRALALRPQVPEFAHTRGMLLVSLGRLDEAIADLDATWLERRGAGNLSSQAAALLEAERCYDLGRLWSARGQRDYAEDYFRRAVMAAPNSQWARRSQHEGVTEQRIRDTFDELVGQEVL